MRFYKKLCSLYVANNSMKVAARARADGITICLPNSLPAFWENIGIRRNSVRFEK
jgi:hypothetical protein